ncbi:transcriptional regulator, HxlR family [Mucilaginibacter lappiensis]|uniref:DNA-binding HxlR family transcriptional regulator n=1 Tax=Mucilaginibacter lappiensis TaxID=354630 RepID=A0ABR6PT12_9SPHI|nr:helix-turn-helix domain-containing protein [Mucilaginibacter lappiensis]MBB6112925.1 DNA-binding HxlR family transcriptional regulator [Mucilaginibacter lappiensis]SIS09308.1 transcriptional regulator, HxlR family [Mucilaginibacter lappiensis]
MTLSFRSNCAISSALDLIGDKWSLLILRDMMFFGKKTFSEFAASEEKIATNILSDRLSNLERASIIKKGKLPNNKKTNIYSLTPKGITFLPSLIEVILWSDRNLAEHITPENKLLADTIKKDKYSFTETMYAKLEKEIIIK